MIICIDVGNTSTVFGLYHNDKLMYAYRIETKSLNDINKSKEMLEKALNNFGFNEINGSCISSVVPSVNDYLKEMLVKNYNVFPLFVDTSLPLGLGIKIEPKESLGADLLVGSYIATTKYGYPNIVIDMGTATTAIVVNEKKEIIGGLIYPGVNEAFKSLVKSTALLENAEIKVPSRVIENSTIGCLQSGMVYGTASLIEGVVNRFKKELKSDDVKVVITGGIAKLFKPIFEDYINDEYLLLEGLNEIYKKINK